MFALLEHTTHDGVHWDFLIEAPGRDRLPTWRLASNPLTTDRAPVAAERIADHRDAYLDYEGPLTGDRGRVRRLDRGRATVHELTDAALTADVDGGHLRGRVLIAPSPAGVLEFRVLPLNR